MKFIDWHRRALAKVLGHYETAVPSLTSNDAFFKPTEFDGADYLKKLDNAEGPGNPLGDALLFGLGTLVYVSDYHNPNSLLFAGTCAVAATGLFALRNRRIFTPARTAQRARILEKLIFKINSTTLTEWEFWNAIRAQMKFQLSPEIDRIDALKKQLFESDCQSSLRQIVPSK